MLKYTARMLIFSSAEINKIIQATEIIQLEYSREDIQKDAERDLKEL